MTREQIEQAASEYCAEICKECGSRDSCDRSKLGHCLPTEDEYDAFVAGANSRQPEIDEITADIERYKQDIAEGLKREEVARKVTADKRAEVDALTFRWRKVPRDKDGFVEWDALGLPQEGTYLRAVCNGDYKVAYELCTESDMKYVKAVLPFPEYEP